MKQIISLLLILTATTLMAQNTYWQQRVEYKMSIDMDVNTNQYTGDQTLTYYNNSPDTLRQVFYHLYFNAFQPGSAMDVRSRSLPDPDLRVRDRIFNFDETEIGYQKVKSLSQDGKSLTYHVEGTILEVKLNNPILPGDKAVFDMKFEAQVPLQTRRSGRDNSEGVRYSMAQWFPKIAEYDKSGWHAHPYIAREFYSPWGDYDVKITIDRDYIIGGTGYLKNANEIGYGYEKPGEKVNRPQGKKLTWHFVAPNVHDFMWAADPNYAHDTVQVPDGPLLRFFYKKDTLVENWKKLQPTMVKAWQYMNREYGKYPYDSYAFVQGGDGGMEYPMATLITGHRNFRSLVGVSVHEAMHSWYQMVLATNESYYAWMDEGFTTYATTVTMQHIFDEEDKTEYTNPLANAYRGYFSLATSGKEEPMTTHSDHYATNMAYSRAAYLKGAVSLHQLGYIVGQDVMKKGLRRYYNTWKFKHPDMNDFVRIMEKNAGLNLRWYYDYWVNTTHTIDYGIGDIVSEGSKTSISLERIGQMPMPVELVVSYTDGSTELYYIPLDLMRGEKQHTDKMKRMVMSDWPWVNPSYTLTIQKPLAQIQKIEIDPSHAMADINKENNVFPRDKDFVLEGTPKK